MACIAIDLSRKPKRAKRRSRVYESDIQRACLDLLARHPKEAWAVRMNSGAFKVEDRFVRAAFKGCSDIIGQLKDGRFLAVEVKRPGSGPTNDQHDFLELVALNRGRSCWVDDAEELSDWLRSV